MRDQRIPPIWKGVGKRGKGKKKKERKTAKPSDLLYKPGLQLTELYIPVFSK